MCGGIFQNSMTNKVSVLSSKFAIYQKLVEFYWYTNANERLVDPPLSISKKVYSLSSFLGYS